MVYSVEYFNDRVRTAIKEWPVGILADYARIIEILMEFGPVLGMPYSRPMEDGLFELRPRGREGIGRAFYCYKKDRRVIILHAFVKKTGSTPQKDLNIARDRLKEVRHDWI